jgi:hypothetical protein
VGGREARARERIAGVSVEPAADLAALRQRVGLQRHQQCGLMNASFRDSLRHARKNVRRPACRHGGLEFRLRRLALRLLLEAPGEPAARRRPRRQQQADDQRNDAEHAQAPLGALLSLRRCLREPCRPLRLHQGRHARGDVVLRLRREPRLVRLARGEEGGDLRRHLLG